MEFCCWNAGNPVYTVFVFGYHKMDKMSSIKKSLNAESLEFVLEVHLNIL